MSEETIAELTGTKPKQANTKTVYVTCPKCGGILSKHCEECEGEGIIEINI